MRIANDNEIEAIKAENPSLDFPFPEMLFARNAVKCKVNSVEISFNPVDALFGCKIKFDSNKVADRNTFKVKGEWRERKDPHGNTIKTWREDFDWTYTTNYFGTFVKNGEKLTPEQTDLKIDYELLRRRDPILFYDAVDLFEDDLFDNGITHLSAKIRVMDSCYFVLMRMWLRVDNVYLRIFDTRVFHEFGKNPTDLCSGHDTFTLFRKGLRLDRTNEEGIHCRSRWNPGSPRYDDSRPGRQATSGGIQ